MIGRMLQVLRKYVSDEQLLCSLIFDEMAIRKHLEWDGHKLEGYVDFRTELDDDSLPVATEALMFLVMPLKGSWKVLIGYFLCDDMASEEKSNLVSEALLRLHDINVKVVHSSVMDRQRILQSPQNLVHH